ncbi:beta-1,3-galactosyltransferase 5-like [Actinia tenebrosa]|uniref:Hexosyltransferase n=1 Tax=Actinia tenebrosa TaxID=6105 RepID=A0A6P8IML6_ACTTE|nr:beta-1,3-galactosyltransferase 5-like [Actinia tenebrosa]
MVVIFRLLPNWLCKNFRKIRVLTVVLFCFITIIYYNQRLPPPPPTSPSNVVWPEFSLHLPFVEPNISFPDRNIYLAVAVNSAATGHKYRGLRKAIRETWGSSLEYTRNKIWKVFFVLAISENKTEHEMNLQEASRNNDVIIGNFTDNYESVVLKTFMSHYWVTTRFPSCRYVLKTDDDVYARVPRLLQWLERAGAPNRFYGGYVSVGFKTVRDPKNKWFISKSQYEKEYWPPFCHGAFHVLSTDILPQFFNYTKFGRKPFHTDDTYLGVVASELGIEAKTLPGFDLRYHTEYIRPRSACDLITSTTMGHMIDAFTMMKYHNFYTKEMKLGKYIRLKCLVSQNAKLFAIAAVVIFCLLIGRLFGATVFRWITKLWQSVCYSSTIEH